MRQSLTLLQRGVIQRLRDCGYNGLADAAKDCWTHRERTNLQGSMFIAREEEQLRADYECCQEQATNSKERRD